MSMYVMNEKLFNLINNLIDTSNRLHLEVPYYSVTDYGQRVALYWDSDAGSNSKRTMGGSLSITQLKLFPYEDDIIGQETNWNPSNQMEQAIVFVKYFLDSHM